MRRPDIARLQLTAPASGTEAPVWAAGLEEVAAAQPQDWAAAVGFSLFRMLRSGDDRPIVFVATRGFLRERGRPYAPGLRALGLAPSRLLLVLAEREAEALWSLEEALKSGAVAGGLATAENAPFVATRRLDFAARAGEAMGVHLRIASVGDLSAARIRWRIGAGPSGVQALDPAAPGPASWRAELVRRRDGPPGAFTLDWEEGNETPRLRLAARLAGDGLDGQGRAASAA